MDERPDTSSESPKKRKKSKHKHDSHVKHKVLTINTYMTSLIRTIIETIVFPNQRQIWGRVLLGISVM